MVKTGSSYLSQSELPLTFGLGTASKVEQVEIRWPSGQVDRLGPQDAGQTLVVVEAKGVTEAHPVRQVDGRQPRALRASGQALVRPTSSGSRRT